MKVRISILLIGFSFFISACTWVELSSEAEAVRLISAEQAQACKLLGKTTVMVKATVATFARNEEKVRTELETLARNNALELNGNAIKPVAAVDQGKQVFEVYQCP
ncbi:MAG: DUF4156 domain-containing protein [Gammaproteobacteria bacterium]|nr:DUF4156 domain-containing protein [Gammaproteobacteria bacterium]